MDEPFPGSVDAIEEIRASHEPPSRNAVLKEIAALDDNCRAFIAHSPFLVLATAAADGRCDAAPKGGPPGFVRVLDDERLLIPEAPGNRRFDSLANLLENPRVGLLFCIPGLEETLRVNGDAWLTRDPELLARVELGGKTPKLAIGVRVEQAYLHCGKAFRRSGLWRPDEWPDRSDMPSYAQMLRDHVAEPGLTVEAIEAASEESYTQRLW